MATPSLLGVVPGATDVEVRTLLDACPSIARVALESCRLPYVRSRINLDTWDARRGIIREELAYVRAELLASARGGEPEWIARRDARLRLTWRWAAVAARAQLRRLDDHRGRAAWFWHDAALGRWWHLHSPIADQLQFQQAAGRA